MFFHNIDPFILRISDGFGVRWYGLAWVLGFVAAYLTLRLLVKKRFLSLTEEGVDSLILSLAVGIVLGARLFHVFVFEPGYYLNHPLDIFMIWKGGLAFHGGLIGGVIALYLFARKRKMKVYALTDALAIPLGLALCLGRIANFINGELYGTVSNVSWCVDYSKSQYIAYPPQGCRHPSQLYEAGKNLIIFGVMFSFYLRDRVRREKWFGTGLYTWTFVFAYGVMRFLITFLRDEPSVLGLGISESQVFSLVMAIVGAIFLVRWLSNKKRQK